jgi:arsenical pump membrane protein
MLLIAGLVPAGVAAHALWDGLDVYLFLAGMIVLAELARIEGVFDWLASLIVPAARGSTGRLFAWVYVLGIGVTAFLSNDATVLLLTPAVLAMVRRAGAPPLPFVFACAFVANAASFVLPISNPANLVVFRELPALRPWIAAFGLPSIAAVGCTYIALRVMHAKALRTHHAADAAATQLSPTGKLTAIVVGVSALLLVICAGFGFSVGRAAFALGAVTLILLARADSSSPRAVLRESPWSIIPMVAGLFIIVAALDRTGVLSAAGAFLQLAAHIAQPLGTLLAGSAVTLAANVFNNLPVGVLARYAAQLPNVPGYLSHAVLVAVDLGPNLSVTGSLATLLWLIALRREGILVTPWQFSKAGLAVTLPALLFALLAVR